MSASLHLYRTRGSKADHLAQDIRVRGLLRECVQTGMPKIIMGTVIRRPSRAGRNGSPIRPEDHR